MDALSPCPADTAAPSPLRFFRIGAKTSTFVSLPSFVGSNEDASESVSGCNSPPPRYSSLIANLNGSSFTGTPPSCSLQEGGTPPNSVTIDLGADDSGVAVNPATHQAFMTGEGTPDVALVSLPKKTVTQIDSSMVSAVTSTLPNTPDGNSFEAEAFPYYTTVDVQHNRGYIVDDYSNYQWLAQVDLKVFQKNPSGISTVLPSGTCGTSVATTFGCDNGNGVVYFPLPAP